ncbi:MAG: OB-fold domain-containing protein [Candidatus Nanopelagicales bacterium]
MSDMASVPVQPRPDTDTAPFWQATAEGRLAMCRCQDCGLWHQPPLERCRSCAGLTAFEEVSGLGTVYSFIVQWHPAVPGYLDDLPYAVGVIELAEQQRLRLPGRIVGIDHADIACGMPVRTVLEPLPGGDFVVPLFRPVDS